MTDRRIPVGGSTTILVRTVVPTPKAGEDGKYPLVFWIHGGGKWYRAPARHHLELFFFPGWTIGDANWDDYKLRRLAVNQRVATVNIEYR